MKPFMRAGGTVAHARKAKNLSMVELAESVRVAPGKIKLIEEGAIRPDFELACKIVDALEMGPRECYRVRESWQEPDRRIFEQWKDLHNPARRGVEMNPMETAPKDRVILLLVNITGHREEWVRAYWTSTRAGKDIGVWAYDHPAMNVRDSMYKWIPSGWIEQENGEVNEQ